MRITVVTGFFLPVPPLKGGATERSWYGLARAFAAAGHQVTFISRRWPTLPVQETAEGIHHVRVAGFAHRRRLAINLLLDFLWGFRVARVLPAADVVVCNAVTLPAWLPFVRKPIGKVAVMVGRTPKGQIPLYWKVARIYAPSTYVMDLIKSRRALAVTKVIGYPIEWADHARAAAQTGNPVTIGFVGRVHPEKGIELLLRAAGLLAAMDGLPEWRLRIVGPVAVEAGGGGEAWAASLRAAIPEALARRIEWLGPEFDAVRLAQVYGTLDVFCYPSLAFGGETFGVAVAEAMAAGGAAVVSDLACFRDLVSDGETGLVFARAEPDAGARLADALRRLVTNPGLRSRLAKQGQEHVRRFDYPEVSAKILADLALLTGSKAKSLQLSDDAR